MVRAYLERLCVTGLTFHYNQYGQPVADCRPRRLLYVTTRGGIVDNSDPALADHGSAYLESICKLRRSFSLCDSLGITGMWVEEPIM